MRKLAIAAAVIVLALGSVLAVAALSLNRLVAGNRDRILQKVTAAVGRDVAVERIRVSLWGGLGIRLENVRVADDPQFGDQAFLLAVAVTGHVRLLPLLWEDLEVTRVDLEEPRVRLMRNTAGAWNYASLLTRAPASEGPVSDAGAAVLAVAARTTEAPLARGLPVIGAARIRNGSVDFSDATQHPARTLHAAHIDAAASDIGEATPIGFSLEAAVGRDAVNVYLEGTIGPLRRRDAVPLQVAGTLGPFGEQDLRVDDLHIEGVLTGDQLRASRLDGRTFGGTFAFTGQLPLVDGGDLALRGRANDISLGQLTALPTEKGAQRLDGVAQVAVDVRGTGNTAESLRRTLAGSVDAHVDRGALRGVNIVGEALDRLSGVDGLHSMLSERVKSKYARILNEPDTSFETLRARLRLADQRARADDITIQATDFGLRASGWIGFDRDADLTGSLVLSKQLSRDVVGGVKVALLLAGADGQLVIPFRLRGRLGQTKPTLDTERILALMGRDVGGNAAGLLEQLLGAKRRPTSEDAAGASQLERDLGKLFGR